MADISVERQEFWAETYGAAIFGAIVLTVFLIAVKLAETGFPLIWLDTQEVIVEDHRVGEDPPVQSFRVIRRDAPLSFLVTVRSKAKDQFVCSSGWRGPYNYRAAASAKNPLVMPLSKWMDTPTLKDIGCTQANGFGAGEFYIETCHKARLLGLIPVERCVDSNVFTRKDDEA